MSSSVEYAKSELARISKDGDEMQDTINKNIIPTGGTVGPISVALAVGGESLTSATAIVTPAAVENYFNVFVAAFIEVPRGCCVTVAVKNTSTQAVSIANSNLIVERVA